MSATGQHALIAGAGYVGSALAAPLAREGRRVTTLRRSRVAPSDGVSALQADLLSGAGLEALPRDIDTVFYTVGADAFSETAYRNAYVTGLTVLLDALKYHDIGARAPDLHLKHRRLRAGQR